MQKVLLPPPRQALSFHTAIQLFFQGEPYINKQLPEMIKYAQANKMYVSISTNGHFINEETVYDVLKNAPDKLIYSVDGLDEKSYQNYRVGGTFKQADEGLRTIIARKKELRLKKPFVEFQFIVMKQNEHLIEDVKKYGKEVGVDKVVFKTMQISTYENAIKFLPSNKKYSRYIVENISFKINREVKNHCFALWRTSVITWDGKVVPCCFDKDAFYELHPQTILINVDWWHSVGRPAPGEEQHTEQELPATVRSEENWHDDYTPHWVEHAGSSQVYKGVRRGWRWVKLALESGHRVHSFNETLRKSKIFLYPEVRNDTAKQYIHAFEAIQSYCHFIANTETPPSFNFDDTNFDWFDGAVSTAGGISPLITAHATKLRSHGKLIVADISPIALIIQQLMMREDFDITNYKQEILNLLDKNFISNEIYGDLFLARANLDRQQEIINETPGLIEYYNTVYKQLNIVYWQTNFFDIYSTNRIWKRFEGLCKVYVNLSNVFHYQNTSWLYSVEERYDFENKLLELIATKGTDKYYVKSNRQTRSWHGELVDDLVARPFKYPDILKELPWHT